jgi:hypothetical protein
VGIDDCAILLLELQQHAGPGHGREGSYGDDADAAN